MDLAGALLISPPNMAHEAIAYAKSGWWVFPVHSPTRRGCSCGRADCDSVGKHPRPCNGLTAATCDLETIEEWWWRWPTANIAAVVPDGLLVVDLDPRHGSDGTAEGLALPDTLTVRTGGGGEHRYYTHPGGDLRQGAAVEGPGVDTRMPGRGYVLLPPSKHSSARRYRWIDASAAVANLPERVIQVLRPRPFRPASRPTATRDTDHRVRRGAYGEAALAREAESVRMALQGCRNDVLNKASFSLGQLVVDGLLDLPEVVDGLMTAARACGLSELEARRTIESGLAAGQRCPRGCIA